LINILDKKVSFIKNEEVKYRELGPSILLSNNGEIFDINSTTADVWNLIDGKRNLNQITDELSVLYSLESEEIKMDIVELLRELLKQGFISTR
jgi:hypothetical protein